jgi:hypothetical protein
MWERPKQGDRVCIVRMDGCMAETRGPEKWGSVERVEDREVYGSGSPVPMALLNFDDGTTAWEVVADAFRKGDHFERQR